MDWNALSAIADLVAAVAVVVSLIYLAVQVRDNSRAARLASMQSALLATQNVAKLPAQNRDLARILRIGLAAPGDLDEDQLQQLRYYVLNIVRVHEDMFVHHRAGVIDDETWNARIASLKTILSTPGGRMIWNAAGAYRPDFKAWLNAQLAQQDPPHGTAAAAERHD